MSTAGIIITTFITLALVVAAIGGGIVIGKNYQDSLRIARVVGGVLFYTIMLTLLIATAPALSKHNVQLDPVAVTICLSLTSIALIISTAVTYFRRQARLDNTTSLPTHH